jgi:hypothetical protein
MYASMHTGNQSQIGCLRGNGSLMAQMHSIVHSIQGLGLNTEYLSTKSHCCAVKYRL